MTHICAWPDCTTEGTFRAPKNPRDLNEKQYFCQAHIKEFNKRWNGLDGFSMDELFQMQSGGATWQRPTRSMGLNAAAEKAQAAPFANAKDLFDFFQNQTPAHRAAPPVIILPADVKEACVVFNIDAPLPAEPLKKAYLALVKQHHPDVNKSANAEDFIKRINVAYKVLSVYAEEGPIHRA